MKPCKRKNWNVLNEIEDLDEQVQEFTELVQEALDEVAPIKSFSIKFIIIIHKQTEGRILGALEVLPISTITYILEVFNLPDLF